MNLKEVLLKIICSIGIPEIFSYFYQRKNNTVLVFHHPSPKSFENAVKYLIKNYSIVKLIQLLNHLNLESSKNNLIITFDDGHKSNYDLLPIIKKYNIPVTIFLTAGIIGTNRHYWFTKKNELNSSSNLKKISNQERLAALSDIGFDQYKEYKNPQALTKEQIMEMAPYVNFQSHTMFHPILPMCDDETARQEIFESKHKLEEDYGLKIYALAYPNGDYTDREIRLCKDAGYKMALTTESGFNDYRTDLFKLKRIGTNDTEDINEFIMRVSGVWHLGLKLKKLFLFWK